MKRIGLLIRAVLGGIVLAHRLTPSGVHVRSADKPEVSADHCYYSEIGYLPMYLYGSGWSDGEEVGLVIYMGFGEVGMPALMRTVSGSWVRNGQFSAYMTTPSAPGYYTIVAYHGSVWKGSVDRASCNYVVV